MSNNAACVLLKERGEEIKKDIITWRRSLHKIPELRMDTPKTEKEIVRILKEISVDKIESGVGGHGVCAIIEGELPGKCLAIRADCDGLPIKEETGLPFASENGNMHACGHDAHTAIALGAVELLSEVRHLLRGCVKFIFQPYEEGDGGAKLMIADNVLKNPDVDAIIALHNQCIDMDCLPGDVFVTSSPITANIYSYEATFHGTSSHICHADTAVNAVYMACRAVSDISSLPSGNKESVNAVSMIHGTFMSIDEISHFIEKRELSPVDLTEACLTRIEKLNLELNAYVYLAAEKALTSAKEAEKEICSGNYRGKLHGIPVALKDLYFTKDMPTTACSKVLKDFIPEYNGTVVERLINSGAIIMGKTNTTEFAFGPTNEESYFGPARNPWNPKKFPEDLPAVQPSQLQAVWRMWVWDLIPAAPFAPRQLCAEPWDSSHLSVLSAPMVLYQ